MSSPRVVRVERLALSFEPRPWPFAEQRRDAITAHFAERARDKPALFNGPVLLMHRHAVENGTLSGAFLRTDFASFLAWRDWGFPDPAIVNCFAQAALQGSDGGFLLGVMASHTSNAGRIYFPSGTPDPNDINGDRVDMLASACRELLEETGVAAERLALDAGWWAVLDGPRIALLKIMRADEPATELRRRILAHLSSDAEPELSDIAIVDDPAALTAMSPPFIHAFLHAVREREGREEQP